MSVDGATARRHQNPPAERRPGSHRIGADRLSAGRGVRPPPLSAIPSAFERRTAPRGAGSCQADRPTRARTGAPATGKHRPTRARTGRGQVFANERHDFANGRHDMMHLDAPGTHRVRERRCRRSLPSEPYVRLSPHTAQASHLRPSHRPIGFILRSSRSPLAELRVPLLVAVQVYKLLGCCTHPCRPHLSGFCGGGEAPRH